MAKDNEYWYKRTIEQLTLMGKSDRTAETYAREVRILGKWVKKPLDDVGEEDLRQFILYRRNECKLGSSSMRILYCGLKALYRDVMGNKWPLLEVIKSQKESKLPIVISRENVARILACATTPQDMTYLRLVYSCGLRLSEALNITVHDIDGQRGLLHVRCGKGAKDRMVPLPDKTYRFLKRYWTRHRNPLLLFPALGRNGKGGPTAEQPASVATVQGGLSRALKKAGLSRKGIRMHTLRHSYATHLLEAGVSIKTVQENLGHTTLQQTLVYLHLTNWGKEDAFNTINAMMKEV
jgi:site-specific recombinase XerD